MLRLFSRAAPTISKSLAPRPSYTSVRNMGSGKADNEQLKGSKLFDVSHITALVTGGGTGIGLMITQALVANGAKVYITSRRDEVLQKTEEIYSTGPGQVISSAYHLNHFKLILTPHTTASKAMSATRTTSSVSTRKCLKKSRRVFSFSSITPALHVMTRPNTRLPANPR